ncbi:ABC transporter ATP-binding protein [Planosporangium sp. 12N6]|uniref:ABC transporter ATP-binding protein n=1 Tax=Planosporangium spinosum TaxID=3402278 RepID=UPI003CF1F595
MDLLTVDDLHVRIGDSHILQGVSFTVPGSGVTALLGRNGAGKTTTLKAILGLVARTGTVVFDGADLAGRRPYEIVRRGIGYAPEDRGVFAGLTVAENLRLAERDRSPRYDLVYELFPELRTRAGQPAGTLSGGQQQMVAIGRTLLNDNRMLLVDEPTKGLAPKIVTEVADVLERAAATVPILLVEQNLALVRRLTDRAVLIAEGRVAYAGALSDEPDRLPELLGVSRA